MKKKRGISWMRKIGWFAFYAAVVFIMYSAVKFKAEQKVREVVIQIETIGNQRSLITEEDILSFVNKKLNKDLENQKIEDLEVKKIERSLNDIRFIESAEVFVNTKGVVFISCKVRTPIVRFDRGDKKGFYLDNHGTVIPLSKRASVRVPVANGYLGEFELNFLTDENSRFRQVFELAKKVNQDEFLHALIEQIYVESNGEVILIPKLGRQKILFGDFASVDNRLEKLKAFYKTGMPNSGWNRFDYLNLKWTDQVVGQKVR